MTVGHTIAAIVWEFEKVGPAILGNGSCPCRWVGNPPNIHNRGLPPPSKGLQSLLAQLRDFEIASCLIKADRTHKDGKKPHEHPTQRRASGESFDDCSPTTAI